MKSTVKKGLMLLVLTVIVTGGAFAQVQGLSLGVRAIGIKPFYTPSSAVEKIAGASVDFEGGFGFGAAAQLSYNFTETVGLQFEVLYNSDNIKVQTSGIQIQTIKANSLLIPVLVRLGTTLWSGMELTGIGGLYFTIPMGDAEAITSSLLGPSQTTKNKWKSPYGAMAGVILGYPLGPGLLFGDFRYGIDFFNTEFGTNGSYDEFFRKHALHIGLGYSFLMEGYGYRRSGRYWR